MVFALTATGIKQNAQQIPVAIGTRCVAVVGTFCVASKVTVAAVFSSWFNSIAALAN
ncbi:hypothetical protein GQ42DRAFT_165370 [Ramicandelaber brevisporus]|nr:hypothetical protein GQ42DRAFT_165370 [Ramicandelaber brevisporus]